VAPVTAGWAPLGGPGVGSVELQFDPDRPNLLYARADGHLWRSEDAGATWRSLQTGLGRSVGELALDPADPKRVWAWTNGGELWRSGDGGETWSRRFADPLVSVRQLLVDPSDPETLYRLEPAWEDSSFGSRVAVSHNGGASFECGASFFPAYGTRISAHPQRGELLAFTENGLEVSTDDGRTWRLRGRYHGKEFLIGKLAPSHPDTLYAVSAGTYCPVRSDDAGAHWLRLACPRLPKDNFGFDAIAVDPRNARHVWLSAFIDDPWLFESKDGGETWSFRHVMPKGGMVPAGGRVIYTGLSVTRDAGRTWRSLAEGISAGDLRGNFVAQRVPGGNAGLRLVGVSRRSLVRSDGGSDWVKLPLQEVVSVAGAGGATVVAVSRHRIVRSEDGGATWSGVASAPPEATDLLSDLTKPLYLALHQFEESDGAAKLFFWTSDDAGATWRRPDEGLPVGCRHLAGSDYCIGISAYAVDPFDATHRWASSEGSIFAFPQIFVSTDTGVSWDTAAAGLPGKPLVHALAADPGTPGRLLAGISPGLFLSEDGGEHWRPWGDLPSGAAVHQFAFDERTATWYAATYSDGIYRSLDGGAHWTLLAGAPDLDSPTIAVDPREPTALLAAFGGAGVWRWTESFNNP
jgi:photosystem II stability/assembly factor-like uncharacterized protein